MHVEVVMKSLVLKARRFLKSEDAATAVEYAVMVSLIIVGCIATVTSLGTNTDATFGKAKAALE
jgi:pilus assembly protein Flp/PilA